VSPARRIALAVAAACVALGAVGSWSLLASARPRAADAGARGAAAALASLPPPPAFDRFAEAEQRPLFAATRRPPVAAPPAAPAEPAVTYRLEGVILAGKQRHAILNDGARTFRVGENDAVGEWTVKRIEPSCVHLAGNGRELAVCKGAKAAKPRS
jgi:hypothetical protein